MARLEPTPNTKYRLFALSDNNCAFPTCKIQYVEIGRAETMLEICHIEAAEENGERWNPNMTDEERRHFSNLVLLCPNHHVETNDEKKYTVEILKEIKSNHEAKMLRKSSSEGILNKYQSSLVEVINRISSSDLLGNVDLETVKSSFNPEDKINYNNVKRYRPTIEEYRVYQGRLTQIYKEIELQGSMKKEQLLENVKALYLTAKGEILEDNYSIENIRSNADNLIESVENGMWRLLENSSNLLKNIPYEAISLSIKVILVDAFIRCKILEEPQKNDN
ncbi:MAG TPA: hypothetical protein PKE69_13815 [Pyrinomonadaceae bacterium]|nr:hypothetical protein [Pyrinomonadaceae bacterium]